MKMRLFVLFILAYGSKERETVAEDGTAREEFGEISAEKPIVVKIEEDEYVKGNKRTSSDYTGVSYDKTKAKWRAQRYSKNENKEVHNGYYASEEAAAHASDTLARKLMENNEQNLKLNFPDDETEVHKKSATSKFIGVSYHKSCSKWHAKRWSKNENKKVFNGYYDTEEAAAHASDTLARELMINGEQNLKLNFPDDETEVHKRQKSSKYIGVIYKKSKLKWQVQRWSKNENKTVSNGYYDNEEAAAHASDALARKFIKNDKQNHKLNFPDEDTEHKNKRKRSHDLENLQDN